MVPILLLERSICFSLGLSRNRSGGRAVRSLSLISISSSSWSPWNADLSRAWSRFPLALILRSRGAVPSEASGTARIWLKLTSSSVIGTEHGSVARELRPRSWNPDSWLWLRSTASSVLSGQKSLAGSWNMLLRVRSRRDNFSRPIKAS